MDATPSRELATELRAVLRLLNERLHTPEQMDGALEQARLLRQSLGGPRRPRWYEGQPRTRDEYSRHSMFRGRENPIAPPLRCTIHTLHDGQRVIDGRVTCSLQYEGPPGGVHGGYVAGLFDDILGGTQQFIDGPSGLTGTLTVRYRQLTPLETELRLRAWIDRVTGRRIVAKATCHAGELLTAEAEALFIRVDMKSLASRAMKHT